MTTSLFEDLEFRGLVKQLTDPSLAQALEKEPITLYIGFDPTSDSLHVGSLLPLITLRRFQLAGHRPIALVGGATGLIGDPSFKAQERQLLTLETVEKNLLGIRKVIEKILSFSGPHPALLRNNADWTKDMSFLDFLREVGKHFTVNMMIAKESVRARLEDREHGISFTEFSYMLLQAYDFLHLRKTENCRLQVGGSDQWGNITAGTDLIRKVLGSNEGVYGMTHPLVMKADGTKFGKTESGAVWLSAEKTSPFRFYQFFVQTTDADVVNYLKYFTFLSHDEIRALERSVQTEPEKRLAQVTLAREVTRLVHGEQELAKAERATQALFGESIRELDEKTLLDVLQDAPSTQKPKTALSPAGVPIVDLLVESGLCSSKGAARKDIAGGGIYVNNARVTEPSFVIRSEALLCGSYCLLRKGKKTYHLVAFR